MAPSKLCNEIRQVPSLPLSPSYKRNNNWTELDRTGESKIFFKNKARLLFVLIYQGNIRNCYYDDLLQTLPYPKKSLYFLFFISHKQQQTKKVRLSHTDMSLERASTGNLMLFFYSPPMPPLCSLLCTPTPSNHTLKAISI